MSDARPLGKDTAVTLGLVLLVVSAVASGAWRLSAVVTVQEAHQERLAKLEAQGGVMVEVLRSLERLTAEVASLRRDMDEQRRRADGR